MENRPRIRQAIPPAEVRSNASIRAAEQYLREVQARKTATRFAIVAILIAAGMGIIASMNNEASGPESNESETEGSGESAIDGAN